MRWCAWLAVAIAIEFGPFDIGIGLAFARPPAAHVIKDLRDLSQGRPPLCLSRAGPPALRVAVLARTRRHVARVTNKVRTALAPIAAPDFVGLSSRQLRLL